MNASFAGAYETVLDVRKCDIRSSIKAVLNSADAARVRVYARERKAGSGGVAVVIQQFVKPEFAGVLFTSDVITGSAARMTGNYVKGVGEKLVSGNSNAEEFSLDALKYKYTGNAEIGPYASRLYKCAVKIRRLYGCPQDIEWAVSGGRLYILQARPITTLRGRKTDIYDINDSLSGEYLFSRTNVGEIFMRPISPATHGVLDAICDILGIPFISNICGQPYANISSICSLLVAFGFSEKKAGQIISDLAGQLPEGTEIPIYPIDRRKILKNISRMFFGKKPKSQYDHDKKQFTENLGTIAEELIRELHGISSNAGLYDFWVNKCDSYMTACMTAIFGSLSLKPLFGTRKKLIKIAGEEMANELCSNCSSGGMLESMKPLFALEDVAAGRMTKEDYRQKYGHRSANELELSCPYPYEDPRFPDNVIEDYRSSGVDVQKLKAVQEEKYKKAAARFKQLYPRKARWLDRELESFSKAAYNREYVRSQGVKLFCLMREFLLRAAELNGLGDDVFMLYFTETMRLLKGDRTVLENIAVRRANYEKYLTLPAFPNIIIGRFEPDKWLADENRRLDIYISGESRLPAADAEIKGYAGAAGIVEGTARVLADISEADTLIKGEILVTTAANIGWTTIFPKVSAIVTDIGAPLSHAAIVAREFGIPAVVGCGNAVTQIRTGDRIRVDGANGLVYKMK
jgi:pyruvate,water dikinase